MKTLFSVNTPAAQKLTGVVTALYILVDGEMRVLLNCTDGGKLVQHIGNTLNKKQIEKLMDAHGVHYDEKGETVCSQK